VAEGEALGMALAVGEAGEPIEAATSGCAHGTEPAMAVDAHRLAAGSAPAEVVVCAVCGPSDSTRKKATITMTGRLISPAIHAARRLLLRRTPAWRLDFRAGIPPPHDSAAGHL
jgi:hypothetical protein